MPMVTVEWVSGRSQEDKDKVARKIAAAIDEVSGVGKGNVWVRFCDVGPADWYLGDDSIAEVRRKRASAVN